MIPSAIAAGDLDGDGVREIVYATALSSVVVLALGADGLYTESGQFPIQSTYVALETGDLDGDGDVDIVGLRNDGTVRIHVNQNGAFPGAPTSSRWPRRRVRSRSGHGRRLGPRRARRERRPRE